MLDYQKFEALLGNMAVSEICKQEGIDPTALSHWKNGDYEPKLKIIAKLAKRFGVPIEYFIKDQEE